MCEVLYNSTDLSNKGLTFILMDFDKHFALRNFGFMKNFKDVDVESF